MKERDEIDTCIVNYLSGEASHSEIQSLKEWINASEDNRKYFEAMEAVYYAVPETEHSFDANNGWLSVQGSFGKEEKKVVRLTNWKMWSAAAVVLTLGLWLWFSYRATPEMRWATTNQMLQQQLPNGVDLFLRENAQLSYMEDEQKVAVELKGEAYFDVKSKGDKDFFVTTDAVVIKDIGTAFRVRNVESEDSIYFNVDDGVIVCYANQNDSLRLSKGQCGYYCRSEKSFGLRTPQRNETAYATKVLEYDNATLERVMLDVQNVYKVAVVFQDPNMAQCTISVHFDQQSIEEIMDVVAMTMNWTVEFNGKEWVFRGANCQQPS